MTVYFLPINRRAVALLCKMEPIDPQRAEASAAEADLADVVATALAAVKEQFIEHLQAALSNQPANILNLQPIFDKLADDAQDAIGGIAAAGAGAALSQIGITDEDLSKLVRSNAEAWAADRAAEMVGRKWVNGELVDNPNAKWAIDQTTRDGIQALTKAALRGGWSTDEMAGNINDAYSFSRNRAETIARTEIGNADSAGAMIGYKASGQVVGKQWITAEDDKVSEECAMNADAGPIPLDEVFPGGVLQPLQHPNCRCALLPVLEGEM